VSTHETTAIGQGAHPRAGAHEALRHAVAEKAPLYRSILEAFAAAKRQFVVHLRPEDVRAALPEGTAADVEEVGEALAQLARWGNLRADPDTSRVTTVEDFNRARYLYSLSAEGEAAEEAFAAFAAALDRRGALQTVALADIRDALGGIARLAAEREPDPAKAHQALRGLAAVFDDLAANAQAFIAALQRTIDLHDSDVTRFLAYKDQLVGYIERFIADLVAIAPDIAVRLRELGEPAALLCLAAEREAADAAPGEEERARAEALAAWRHRWAGLSQWFLGTREQPAQADLLRRRARQAITALLTVVATLGERRSGRSDRSQDFRELARWFAEAPTEEDCHRLWRTAFALAPARHLTVDAATIDARQAAPVPPATPWAEAPPVRLSPRLRRTGSHERRGKPSRIADRGPERALLAEQLATEAAQTARARAALATDGTVRLSELATLDRDAFDLLLELLGEALAWPNPHGEPVEVTTGDGSLRLVLTPTGDGAEAAVTTRDGTLRGPDHHVRITDLHAAPGQGETDDVNGDDTTARIVEGARR